MSHECECRQTHFRRRIVLTGGPGAGKTAVLELLRHSLCSHVTVLEEAAGIVFGGGFPRRESRGARVAAQKAIYHVQLALEECAESEGHTIVLCDRGVVDGYAYWPDPKTFWSSVGTTHEDALSRYDAVVHLRVPAGDGGYDHRNPLRVESSLEARRIDDLILEAWNGHPNRYVIEPSTTFLEKAERALAVLRTELPRCCRDHVSEAVFEIKEAQHVQPT